MNVDWNSLWTSLLTFGANVGGKLLVSALFLIIGFHLIKRLTRHLSGGKQMPHVDKSVKSFLVSFLSIGLKILLLMTVAAYIGIPMTSVITMIGSAGLAVGLSLQGSLSNLAGGLMILIYKPFSVGDYIDNGTVSGIVSDIGIFYTRLVTLDNKVTVIPNGLISNQTLTNMTLKEERRVDLTFSASYDADVDKVKTTLIETALSVEAVLSEPEPEAHLMTHGDSALIYVLRAWCKREDYWKVYFSLNEQVKKNFDKAGIAIPYPQLDVHMEK